MDLITKDDLLLVNDLTRRDYTHNSLNSNATSGERDILFKDIKPKLRGLANYFANKYGLDYGPFAVDVFGGNPLKRADRATGIGKLNRIWGGIFKGAPNKQYAAQISFVMNPYEPCLDVGFYFGRASAHAMHADQKRELESTLNLLGLSLSNAIINNEEIKRRYDQLFEYGFSAYSNGERVDDNDWYNIIRRDTKNSQIIAQIYPNDFGVIDNSTIDAYVAQLVFLMGAIDNKIKKSMPPSSPEQRSKRAERLSQIGLEGEQYILDQEKERIGILHPQLKQKYPRHVALETDTLGYDILSLDEDGNEIWIEVKTTTRRRGGYGSNSFFISSNEYEVFKSNKDRYRLYRVYDIEGEPSFDVLNIEDMELCADGYIAKY